MAVSMMDKRQALTDYCTGILQAHQAGLKAEQRFRRATELKVTRRERVAVMGDPVYYLEVIETGPTERTISDAQGIWHEVIGEPQPVPSGLFNMRCKRFHGFKILGWHWPKTESHRVSLFVYAFCL